MNSFEAYKMYLALKMHFSQKTYNYFQYNGQVKANVASFEKRRDRLQFKKLSKHKDLEGLIVSNMITERVVAPYDLNSSNADDIYKKWLQRRQALSYVFKEELNLLDEDFKSNFTIPSGSLPKVVLLYLQKKLSLESLVILLYTTNAIDYYDKKLAGNTLWKELSFKVRKYKPFCQYDEKALKTYIKENFDIKQKVSS